MTSKIEAEFSRLRAVYQALGKDLHEQPPATQEQIGSIAATTGVEVDDDLKALWHISNGSDGRMWFAEGEGEFTPYSLLSVEEVMEYACYFGGALRFER